MRSVRGCLESRGTRPQLGNPVPVGGLRALRNNAVMRREIAFASLLLLAACEASIGGDRSELVTDASTQDDADPTRGLDAPNGPACMNGRVVYLNFEGQTLNDAAASDATLNRASWMQIATGTAPKFLAANANRAMIIAAITQGVRDQLAQFPVTVVTQRPASGPYVMIVYGGTAQNVGSNYGFSVNELDCDDSEKSDVAWISDNYTTTQRHVNTTIGAIGFGLGLTGTTDVNDCMCGWANGCIKDHSQPCTLGSNIARDPNATQRCTGAGAQQNEVAAFSTAFCE
jgi:hypothetical protein